MTHFEVYYTKPEHFRNATMSMFSDVLPSVASLQDTHTYLLTIEASDLEDVFAAMQGENWSPNGEARELLQSVGLHHTSMSVGDVIHDLANDEWVVVSSFGFKRLQ